MGRNMFDGWHDQLFVLQLQTVCQAIGIATLLPRQSMRMIGHCDVSPLITNNVGVNSDTLNACNAV